MSYDGLTNLWQIGRSNKRLDEIEKRHKRKQIGKFGIGKLAARTIANKLTYITKSKDGILTVTVDFRDFSDSPTGSVKPVAAPVHVIDDWDGFVASASFSHMLSLSGIALESISAKDGKPWTIAILEDLTDKAKEIKIETLEWVLSTAMPLQSDFRLYLNCNEVKSSKESYEKAVEFDLSQLPSARLKSLKKSSGEDWRIEGKSIKSPSFPSGISGSVLVTQRTLKGGKSDDIVRSHGFFIRVRHRLVNENDALFGLTPLFFGTFSRFHADIEADDLDSGLKASRETIEEATLKVVFRTVLREIYQEADSRYSHWQAEQEKNNLKKEGERNQVSPRLVEYPVADLLVNPFDGLEGAEADKSWFYVEIAHDANLEELIKSLYSAERLKYKYEYTNNGRTGRLVKFNPDKSTFWINQDHEFVAEYSQDATTRHLLHDMVTAEALLEVYLRQNQVPLNIIGKVLEQRDELLRSLAKDRSYSFESISKRLRDAAADEHELEISLVVAARALGFVALHVSGGGKPDGLAVFTHYPDGEKKITLEAKSSDSAPSLSAIAFDGLREHVSNEKADGCLLVAPSYPGEGRGDSSAVANRSRELKISCWTIEQLARFVASAEKRQLNARHVLDIVLKCFSPKEVTAALDKLLAQPRWDQRELYRAIVRALRQLEGRLPDSPRTIDLIAAEVSRESEFCSIERKAIENATKDLEGASQGGMTLRDANIVMHVSQAELERRLSNLTKDSTEPRRRSSFRENG